MFFPALPSEPLVCALIRRGGKILDVILHIGAHRTGNSSFQSYLRLNQDALSGYGVAFWGPETLRRGVGSGLLRLAPDASPLDMMRAQRSAGLLRIEMERMDHDALTDQLIVSDQNILGSIRHNLAAERLYPNVRQRLSRFVEVFAARCSRVVLAIRSYDSYWASGMAWALPNGAAFPTEAALDRLVTQPRRWRTVIAEVSGLFPRAECVVWPFEALIGSAASQLVAATGEPIPALSASDLWTLPSPGRDLLREVLQNRREPGPAAALPAGDGRWQPFAPHHIEVLQAQYDEDIAWLRSGADGQASFVDYVTPNDAGPHPHRPNDPRGQPDDRQDPLRHHAGLG